MLRVNLVTGNHHKAEELRSVLPGIVQVDIDLSEVQAVDSREVIAAKLIEARKHLPKGALMVEDTALHLAGLNGFPGALIKWLLVSVGCQGIYNLCGKLGNYEAEARTVLGYVPDGSDLPVFFDASIQGVISPPAGERGFGWDSIFTPKGSNKTLAEMPESELQAVKMRRTAAEKLVRWLSEIKERPSGM